MSRLLPAALTLLLGACASITIEQDFDPAADFGQFRTWAWHPLRLTAVGEDLEGGAPRPGLAAALEEELTLRGLLPAEAAAADLLLTWNASVRRSQIAAADPPHYDYRSWNRTSTGQQVTHIDEDVIVIDLVDARTNRLVWRGTARGVVHAHASLERRERRLREVLRKLLATYPPASDAVP